MSSGWHVKYGPRRYKRFHSFKTLTFPSLIVAGFPLRKNLEKDSPWLLVLPWDCDIVRNSILREDDELMVRSNQAFRGETMPSRDIDRP